MPRYSIEVDTERPGAQHPVIDAGLALVEELDRSGEYASVVAVTDARTGEQLAQWQPEGTHGPDPYDGPSAFTPGPDDPDPRYRIEADTAHPDAREIVRAAAEHLACEVDYDGQRYYDASVDAFDHAADGPGAVVGRWELDGAENNAAADPDGIY